MAEYEEFGKNEYESLRTEAKNLIAESLDAKDVIQRVLKTISDIVSLASCTPTKVGQGEEWTRIVDAAQEDRAKLCAILRGKRLFSPLYGVHCLTLANLKSVLQNSVGKATETPQTDPCPQKPSPMTQTDSSKGNGGKEMPQGRKDRQNCNQHKISSPC